mmetsp:Transcript_4115/g.9898  ORF Transcript_4115/g.9898 Transcript_4115/m.9898 type:complete len:277 (+) Transcript_4115:595-1425(+)
MLPVLGFLGRERDGAVVRELDGVAQQVRQDLVDAPRVPLDLRQHLPLRAHLVHQRYPVFDEGGEDVTGSLAHVGHVDRLVTHNERVVPGRRRVENVVDEPRQALARGPHQPETLKHLWRARLVHGKTVGEADNAIEGSAKLVGDGGEEVVLRLLHVEERELSLDEAGGVALVHEDSVASAHRVLGRDELDCSPAIPGRVLLDLQNQLPVAGPQSCDLRQLSGKLLFRRKFTRLQQFAQRYAPLRVAGRAGGCWVQLVELVGALVAVDQLPRHVEQH